MPSAQGRHRQPGLVGLQLFEAGSSPPIDGNSLVLQPRSFLRGLFEAEIYLRVVNSNIPHFPAVEVAQRHPRRLTFAARDRGRDQVVDLTAQAREKNGGPPPGNWRGSRG
jgi:hypothetical protein